MPFHIWACAKVLRTKLIKLRSENEVLYIIESGVYLLRCLLHRAPPLRLYVHARVCGSVAVRQCGECGSKLQCGGDFIRMRKGVSRDII